MRSPFAIVRRRYVVAALALLLAGTSILADTVYLKNGQVLVGRVTTQSQQMMQLEVNGQLITLQKSQVARIIYDKAVDPAEAARRAEEARQAQIARQKALEEQRKLDEEARLKQQEELRRKEQDDRQKKEQKDADDRAEKQRQEDLRRGPAPPRIVLLSALLPGYGQMSSDHKIRGTAYMALFFTSLAGFAYSRNAAGQAHIAYNNAVQNYWIAQALLSPQEALLSYNDSAKRTYDTRINQANTAATLVFLAYGLQLADAHSLSQPNRSNVALAYSWSF